MPNVTIATAFLAGLVSFVSPCVLPLVPSYLSFLTGSSVEDLKAYNSREERLRVMLHALAFVAGFTVIFVLLGLSASAIGDLLGRHKTLISQIGGAILVVLGLSMMGMLRIPLFMMDKRLRVQGRPPSFLTSFLIGLAFAAGWSPCVGPILGAILAMASQGQNGEAMVYLFVYSMGLGVPFLLTAAALTSALSVFDRIKPNLPKIEFASGLLLIATGIVLADDGFLRIAGYFYQFVPPPKI